MSISDSDNQGGKLSDVLDETAWDFPFTGACQHFVVPQDGTYKLEAWGAGGTLVQTSAPGGKGGYAAGESHLKRGQIFYIYAGETPARTAAAFNGGGAGNLYNNNFRGGAGGGATDMRLVGGEWNNATSLNSRILIAGGGSGGGYDPQAGTSYAPGAGAGGLTGYDVNNTKPGCNKGYGGKQNNGGSGSSAGSFGKGGNAGGDSNCSGGGGGYYGGGGSSKDAGYAGASSGGGGSSFISGMPGCMAINPASTSNPRTQDTNGDKTALNYSNSIFGGASPTWNDGEDIIFSNPSMVDGQGYQWNTGAKGSQTNMPNPSGSTMQGNTGNGYARITLLAPTP
jgi:hypothetical protein